MALLVALGACSSTGAEPPASTSTTVTPSTTTAPSTTLRTAPDAPFGYVSDFMNAVAPRLGVAPEFSAPRDRATPDFETQFVTLLRGFVVDNLGTDLTDLDDDEVLYLGYLYCLGIDFGVSPAESTSVVAQTIARARGREGDVPTRDDTALAVAVTQVAGGSLCGEYWPETQAFLVSIGGEPQG